MGCGILIVDDVEDEALELAELVRRAPVAHDAAIRTLFSADDLKAQLGSGQAPDVLFIDIALDERMTASTSCASSGSGCARRSST